MTCKDCKAVNREVIKVLEEIQTEIESESAYMTFDLADVYTIIQDKIEELQK